MISGYTLLTKSANYGSEYFHKRIKRIGIPILFWTTMATLFNLLIELKNGISLFEIDWSRLFLDLILLKSNGYMWFFYPLIIVYITVPFFNVFVQNADKTLHEKFLKVGFILVAILPITLKFVEIRGLDVFFPMGADYLYMCFAGYYLGNYELSDKSKRILYVVGFISACFICVYTYIMTLNNPLYYRLFINYTFFPCTLTSWAVFVFVKNIDWDKNKLTYLGDLLDYLPYIASLSLGIYLFQYFALCVLSKVTFFESYNLLKFLATYIVCIIAVAVMKKIPFIKKTI